MRELDSTVADGDPVRVDIDTGHAAICAAAGTIAIYGWATCAGVAGDTIPILLATPDTEVLMTLENAYAAIQDGVFYALVGTTGAFFLDNNKTDADVLALVTCLKGSTTEAWAMPVRFCTESQA